MKNKEILIAAIEKAWKNGYQEGLHPMEIPEFNAYEVIFSHDFAKAFCGEERIVDCCECSVGEPVWKSFLKEMVLEEDPIQYLQQFLK